MIGQNPAARGHRLGNSRPLSAEPMTIALLVALAASLALMAWIVKRLEKAA